MNKTNKTLLIILAIALILLGAFAFFGYNDCGNACHNKSLLNPFAKPSDFCIQVCASEFSTLTYVLADLFILTFAIFIIFNLLKGGSKK